MKKRWVLCIGIVLAILLVAIAIAVDPTCVLQGVLKRESFFLGRPTSYWRAAIKHRDHDIYRSFGIEWGGRPDAAAVPVLIELLQDTDDQVRAEACMCLAVFGPEARAAVPILVKLLKHPDLYDRRRASYTLAAVVSPGETGEVITTLAEALEEDDTFANYYCVVALGRIGREASDAVPALIALSRRDRAKIQIPPGGNMSVADAATWALEQINPGGLEKQGFDPL